MGLPIQLGGGEEVYASVEDVGILLEMTFSQSTKPTTAEVEELLIQMTSMIEEETHHTWRDVQVVDEYHDAGTWVPGWGSFGWECMIKLRHRAVRQFSSVDGDKIEYWNGAVWTNILATGVEGRNNDFWCDYNSGILYSRGRIPQSMNSSWRVTYRYGETTVPGDLRMTCAKMAAKEIVRAENRVELLVEGTTHMIWGDKIKGWNEEIQNVLDRHKEHGWGLY
jgi:hypothetical protein